MNISTMKAISFKASMFINTSGHLEVVGRGVETSKDEAPTLHELHSTGSCDPPGVLRHGPNDHGDEGHDATQRG